MKMITQVIKGMSTILLLHLVENASYKLDIEPSKRWITYIDKFVELHFKKFGLKDIKLLHVRKFWLNFKYAGGQFIVLSKKNYITPTYLTVDAVNWHFIYMMWGKIRPVISRNLTAASGTLHCCGAPVAITRLIYTYDWFFQTEKRLKLNATFTHINVGVSGITLHELRTLDIWIRREEYLFLGYAGFRSPQEFSPISPMKVYLV